MFLKLPYSQKRKQPLYNEARSFGAERAPKIALPEVTRADTEKIEGKKISQAGK